MNVSKATIDALYELITQCFQYNRWLDRMVSVLGVKFACNQSAERIHKYFAHWFPIASDYIGHTCLETYNIDVKYGATSEGNQNYESVTSMLEEMQEKIIDFQNMLSGAILVAYKNNDINIYADLMVLMRAYRARVEQSILILDKIKIYGEDRISNFDHDFDKFWIIDDNNEIGGGY